jgi:hypothetical protein
MQIGHHFNTFISVFVSMLVTHQTIFYMQNGLLACIKIQKETSELIKKKIYPNFTTY